jgi:hypothetical protein
MWGKVSICLVAAVAAAAVAWYLFFRRSNRRRAGCVVEWVQAALAGKGEVVAIRWLGPSIFQVALRLGTSLFQHPALTVHLVPRQNLLKWLRQHWRREPATVTFEADLDSPPGFNLQVHQHSWSGRSSKRSSPGPEHWEFEQNTPLILTSDPCWQREAASMMNALLSCRERAVLSLGFRHTSPHFTATIPLECISPEGRAGSNVFDTLRELAAGASASRM